MSALPPKSWLLLRSGPGEAAFNMALDAALLENASSLGRPVLRFYGWTQPAASFGYFQKYADIEGMTKLRPLVRRPTGGGLVPHDADWTYSFIVPPTDEWHALKAPESYQRMHEWIRAAFLKLDVAVELASHSRKTLPGRCFEGHEKSDVLWHGKKLAGAAQRRNRDGLLIQGSVQPPPIQISREHWEDAMCKSAEENLSVMWNDHALTPLLIQRVKELTDQTYSQEAHNRRR